MIMGCPLMLPHERENKTESNKIKYQMANLNSNVWYNKHESIRITLSFGQITENDKFYIDVIVVVFSFQTARL